MSQHCVLYYTTNPRPIPTYLPDFSTGPLHPSIDAHLAPLAFKVEFESSWVRSLVSMYELTREYMFDGRPPPGWEQEPLETLLDWRTNELELWRRYRWAHLCVDDVKRHTITDGYPSGTREGEAARKLFFERPPRENDEVGWRAWHEVLLALRLEYMLEQHRASWDPVDERIRELQMQRDANRVAVQPKISPSTLPPPSSEHTPSSPTAPLAPTTPSALPPATSPTPSLPPSLSRALQTLANGAEAFPPASSSTLAHQSHTTSNLTHSRPILNPSDPPCGSPPASLGTSPLSTAPGGRIDAASTAGSNSRVSMDTDERSLPAQLAARPPLGEIGAAEEGQMDWSSSANSGVVKCSYRLAPPSPPGSRLRRRVRGDHHLPFGRFGRKENDESGENVCGDDYKLGV